MRQVVVRGSMSEAGWNRKIIGQPYEVCFRQKKGQKEGAMKELVGRPEVERVVQERKREAAGGLGHGHSAGGGLSEQDSSGKLVLVDGGCYAGR